MGKFRPLEEYLDEEWNDPNKRKELRKAVFERIAELERSREQLDCRYAGSLWESSGSHCPIDKPCMRCAMQARLDAVVKLIPEFYKDELKKILEQKE